MSWQRKKQADAIQSKPTATSGRVKRTLLILVVVAIYMAHQDFWNWTRIEPLLCAFLPVGLWYHGAYCLLASVLMWLLVKFAWPKAIDETVAQPPENDAR